MTVAKSTFELVVDDLRARFPEETKNILFIDKVNPAAFQQLVDWYESIPQKSRTEINDKAQVANAADFATALMGEVGFAVRAPGSHEKLIIVSSENTLPGVDVKKMLAYTLAHELAHLLINNAAPRTGWGMPEKELMTHTHSREVVADVFAALFCLQTGIMSPDELRGLANFRAFAAWRFGDLQHATSKATTAVLEKTQGMDMSSLSNAEIIKLCVKLSADVQEDSDTLNKLGDRLEKIVEPFRTKEAPAANNNAAIAISLEELSLLCLESKKDSLAFSISSLVLDKFVNNPTARTNLGLTGDYWDEVGAMVTRKIQMPERTNDGVVITSKPPLKRGFT